MNGETTMLLALAIPVLTAVLIGLLGRWPNMREAVTLVGAGMLFLCVASLTPGVLAGERPELLFIEFFPGLKLSFLLEPLGMIFALVASFLWIINSIYSIGYMRGNQEQKQTRFYICFAVALASTMGIALAGNMLTLFVFYEALTLSTYPLVVHKESEAARAGGRTYLGILLTTSIAFLLLAVVWTWSATGTLDFRAGGILAGEMHGPMVGVLLALYMFGIGKAALLPFHRWLPAAMVAPTPVSALLHAVAVVKAGVFSVVKVVVYIFGLEFMQAEPSTDWLLYMAGASILIASMVALRQDNLKRRLAYSTVSQLSYVTMATAILAPLSMVGAALHIAAHAFGKITLFFAAGSIYTAAHKTKVSELNGIGWRMPWTMGAFAVGSLSMIGVPPTIGFVSKWYMLQGAFSTGQMFAVAVIFVSTLLNAAYFLPVVYAAFFRKPAVGEDSPEHGEAPWPVVLALTLTAAGTIVLFFLPALPLGLAKGLMGL